MYWLHGPRVSLDGHQEPHQDQSSSDDRPGKFSNLSEFMDVNNGLRPATVPGTRAHVDPGHVIYIKDRSANTRINNRIMLVLFHNQPFSYTCLSFCRHLEFDSETLRNSHAHVRKGSSQRGLDQAFQDLQVNTNLPSLKLKLSCSNIARAVQPDIYLNLREHWNIEQEVQFAILGRVETESYNRLKYDIQRLFCQSLFGANVVDASGNPPPLAGHAVARPEGRHSTRKDNVRVINTRPEVAQRDRHNYVPQENVRTSEDDIRYATPGGKKRHSRYKWPLTRENLRGDE